MRRWIVLSGGNGRGAYQAGAIQILENSGIKFQGAAGISVGALNAAGVATGRTSKVLTAWQTITEPEIIKRGSEVGFILDLIAGRLLGWAGYTRRTGLDDTRPLRKKLEEIFKGASLQMPFYAGRLDIRRAMYGDGVLGGDPFIKAIWRSGLVPFTMRADLDEEIGAIWVDGGVENVTPLKRIAEIADEGDEVWIILNMRRSTRPKGIDKDAKDIDAFDILKATIDYLVDRQFIQDVRTFLDRNELAYKGAEGYKYFNTHVLEPTQGLGSGSDYSRASLNFRYDLGMADARAYLNAMQ